MDREIREPFWSRFTSEKKGTFIGQLMENCLSGHSCAVEKALNLLACPAPALIYTSAVYRST